VTTLLAVVVVVVVVVAVEVGVEGEVVEEAEEVVA
jgi:hypothetical protein